MFELDAQLTSFEEVPDLLRKLILSSVRLRKLSNERPEDVTRSSRYSSFSLQRKKERGKTKRRVSLRSLAPLKSLDLGWTTHPPQSTLDAEPLILRYVVDVDGRIETREVEGPRTSVAAEETTVSSTGFAVVVVELIDYPK